MKIPLGIRPVYSATPQRKPVPLTRDEVRDVAYLPSDGPRGYGSQFASWLPSHK